MKPQSGGEKLTAKQETFARLIALENMTQVDAYMVAYNKGDIALSGAYSRASNLMKSSKIIARINELRQQVIDNTKWSREEMLLSLKRIVEKEEKEYCDVMEIDGKVRRKSDTSAHNVVIKAIAQASKMLGYDQTSTSISSKEEKETIEIVIKDFSQ